MQADQVNDPDYEHALRFLYDRINYERLLQGASRYPFGLQRMEELLRRLDLSQYLYDSTESSTLPAKPLVHIGGTKGKGSTAAMVAAVLTASGRRTGLYTSPHLHTLEERFRVNGKPCSRADLVALVKKIEPVATAMTQSQGGSPSFFELTTALGLLHFHQSECEAIVLEVGLGGRLDSTNVCSPSVCAVTSVGLDHQHVLGDTLPQIAAEKAGIVKQGVPVVSGVMNTEAAAVVTERATELNAPLFQLGRDFNFASQRNADWGSQLTYRGGGPLSSSLTAPLAMEGAHQSRNASVAMAICDVLRGQGLAIPTSAIREGLEQLQCPGRIERFLLPEGVVGIIDSAHNEDSMEALCQCLRDRSAGRPVHVVFGTSTDKSASPMLELLSDVADQLIITRFFDNPRFQPPEQLLSLVPPTHASRCRLVEKPIPACESALASLYQGGREGFLVVCGSFFLAAETRKWMAAQCV